MAKFISVTMKIDTSRLDKKIAGYNRAIKEMPKRALDFFIQQTPVSSGNARRNTRMKDATHIFANYAYADRLDKGWSQQSTDGMTKPTQDWLEAEFKKIFRKK
jgi:hypothetical protein